MMKRFAGIVMSAMLLVVMCAAPVSAADFELTDSNPKDGYEKVEAKNVMVKLFFSEDVSGEETQKANKDKIALKDSDGKAVDFEILYDSKDSKKISIRDGPRPARWSVIRRTSTLPTIFSTI